MKYFILAVIIWFWIQIYIDSSFSCSQFSDNPGSCNSDNHPQAKGG